MQMECPICCQVKQQLLFSIANCSHQFCLDCCMAHVQTKADLFTDIYCPDNNCKKPFDKNSSVFNRLPTKTIENIKKKERLNYRALHPELKSCSVTNCEGVFNINLQKKYCDICGAAHCPKCLKIFHNGPCLLDAHQQQMRALNFQKCPNCSAWVEKKEGCNFIDCKCGNTFCYTCGVNFSEDPCRLAELWNTDLEIRKLLKTFKYKLPQQKIYYPLLAIKIPLQLILFILFTVTFSLISVSIILLFVTLLIGLSPLLIIALSCSAQDCLITVICIILLPLITILGILFILLVFIIYPFGRRCNHHGIYDGFDFVVYTATKLYIRGALCIFNI